MTRLEDCDTLHRAQEQIRPPAVAHTGRNLLDEVTTIIAVSCQSYAAFLSILIRQNKQTEVHNRTFTITLAIASHSSNYWA